MPEYPVASPIQGEATGAQEEKHGEIQRRK